MTSSKSAMKTFVSEHKDLLTVLGALIVFVTFVVDNVLRDDAAGLAASLNRALILSELRSDLSQLLTTAGETEQLVHALGDKQDAHPSTAENEAWVRRGTEGASLEFASIAELAQKALPDDVTLTKELQIVHKQMDADQQIQAILLDVASNPNHQSPADFAARLANVMSARPSEPDAFTSIPASQTFPKAGGGTINIPLFGYQRLAYDNQKFFGLVQEKQEEAEHRAHDWRLLSFALYPLGLILSLAGKLFGTDLGTE
jgi:hypothetical protein